MPSASSCHNEASMPSAAAEDQVSPPGTPSASECQDDKSLPAASAADKATHQLASTCDEKANETVGSAEDAICVVCWERPKGAPLQPCGHNHFCNYCVKHFRTCPLCRVPIIQPDQEDPEEQREEGGPRRPTFISQREAQSVFCLGCIVFAFLVIAGYIEWRHDTPQGCSLATSSRHNASQERISAYHAVRNVCKSCTRSYGGPRCSECHSGLINGGLQCYLYLDDLPRVKTGAALGGTFYFTLIIITQLCGMLTEVVLIRRMRARNLMPRKELVVLLSALAIEVTRMLLVDVFILQEYFGGRSYAVFRFPVPCHETAIGSWQGADSNWYCADQLPYTASTSYYIGSTREAFTANSDICSAFTKKSALLDYDEHTGSWPIHAGGHPRFSRLGWVVGGEFALYYFFATFINEVADNMFVVPTVANFGWFCKAFSVALELFQLGALCPAAIFTHSNCLHYTDPLGVDLGPIRDIVTLFGYCIWGFGLMMFPLGAIGFLIIIILVFINSCVLRCMVFPVRWCCGAHAAQALNEFRLRMEGQLRATYYFFLKSKGTAFTAMMMLAFLPLLCSGMFLGALVVVGQASKSGAMQVLTAIVLLSDVLFKIIATAVTETVDYMLHVRVRNAVANAARSQPQGDAIGNPQLIGDEEVETE